MGRHLLLGYWDNGVGFGGDRGESLQEGVAGEGLGHHC